MTHISHDVFEYRSCREFASLSNYTKSIKFDQSLRKLWPIVYGQVFVAHGVVCCFSNASHNGMYQLRFMTGL